MRHSMSATLLACLILGGASAHASPLFDDVVLSGAWEYSEACAVCHGADGAGNGALAGALKQAPPDLTRLAEQNGGRFPFERVFRIIDGRTPVEGHGGTDMPVWGRTFNQDAAEDSGRPLFGPDQQMVVAGRIYALARYLRAIQGGQKVPLIEPKRPRRHWPEDIPRMQVR